MMQKALTLAAPGTQVFGVPGLTTGAVAICVFLIGNIIINWVKGIGDRKRADNDSKRADNEGVTSLSSAHDVLFKHMQAEIDRLTAIVTAQGMEIAQLKRELHETRKDELGSIRNAAQTDLSIIAATKGEEA